MGYGTWKHGSGIRTTTNNVRGSSVHYDRSNDSISLSTHRADSQGSQGAGGHEFSVAAKRSIFLIFDFFLEMIDLFPPNFCRTDLIPFIPVYSDFPSSYCKFTFSSELIEDKDSVYSIKRTVTDYPIRNQFFRFENLGKYNIKKKMSIIMQ